MVLTGQRQLAKLPWLSIDKELGNACRARGPADSPDPDVSRRWHMNEDPSPNRQILEGLAVPLASARRHETEVAGVPPGSSPGIAVVAERHVPVATVPRRAGRSLFAQLRDVALGRVVDQPRSRDIAMVVDREVLEKHDVDRYVKPPVQVGHDAFGTRVHGASNDDQIEFAS